VSELKVGDKVYTGPYEIVQFRDTYNPGPQDTGDTVILARGDHGAMGADTSLTIPATDNLAAVARVLAAHPGMGEALTRMERWISSGFDNPNDDIPDQYGPMPDGQWDRDIAAVRALAAALGGTA